MSQLEVVCAQIFHNFSINFISLSKSNDFDGKAFEGLIYAWQPPDKDDDDDDEPFFRFRMDDGDEEDLTTAEAKAAIKRAQKSKSKKKSPPLELGTESPLAIVPQQGGMQVKKKIEYRGANMKNCLETEDGKKLLILAQLRGLELPARALQIGELERQGRRLRYGEVVFNLCTKAQFLIHFVANGLFIESQTMKKSSQACNLFLLRGH